MKPDGLPDRFLSVLEEDILPLTRQGVSRGNKIFGAAVVRKPNLELVVAGTNGCIEKCIRRAIRQLPAAQRRSTDTAQI